MCVCLLFECVLEFVCPKTPVAQHDDEDRREEKMVKKKKKSVEWKTLRAQH